MEKFRNLSNNIFFKIFLGFLGLTFITFGISGFILGGGGSWIVKVGSTTVDYNQFLNTAQLRREAIYRSNPSEEVLKYLNSDQYKKDILGNIITQNLIGQLKEKYKIYPNEDLILTEILASEALKGEDGKFSRIKYQNYLRSNSITEKQHISDIANEIAGNIIIQSFITTTPTNEDLVKAIYKNRFETRQTDVIIVNSKNIDKIKIPNDFELTDFFNKNKDRFSLPQMRKVSFISFDKSKLNNPIKITNQEIEQEYKRNISDYEISQTRDFYQILFDNKEEAEEFFKSLKAASSQTETSKADVFAGLAMDKDKNKKSILLTKVKKGDLPHEVASKAFLLNKNQYSEVLESNLGWHIFYLLDVTPAKQLSLKKVRQQIKDKLLAKKKETHIQDQLAKVEESLLTSKSLSQVADKFNFKLTQDVTKFSSKGLDIRQDPIEEIKNFDQFVNNAFLINKGEISRLFYSKTNDKYYALIVNDIELKRERSLDEVMVLATDLWIKEQKQEKLKNLAQEISQQINQNGINASKVASKNGLKITRNQLFPRFYMIDIQDGRKVPYANKLLNKIFSLDINQASLPIKTGNEEFTIAVVKKIIEPKINQKTLEQTRQELEKEFKNDLLVQYNQYVQNKFPVKVNEKLLQSSFSQEN
jgi:peptidyl-prolyl cis-trans isomerase D